MGWRRRSALKLVKSGEHGAEISRDIFNLIANVFVDPALKVLPLDHYRAFTDAR